MNRSRSSWLILLFLLFGVLAPTGCVLWFMNAAAQSQGAIARQRMTDAWRGQLRLLRDRADSFWLERAAAINAMLVDSEPLTFQRVVRQGLADSLVQFHYPSPARESFYSVPGSPEWQSAVELEKLPGRLRDAAEFYGHVARSESNLEAASRAAQSEIRCLVRSGDREGALRQIERYFLKGRLRRHVNSETRSILADEFLLNLRLLKPEDPRYSPAAQRLADTLNDYADTTLPSAQRLFLMDEFASAFPATVTFATREAERLALQYLEAETVGSADRNLERSQVADVWKMSVASGRATALFRTATVQGATRAMLAERNSSPNVKFTLLPPGAPNEPEAIPAGSLLPGWQLSFSLVDPRSLDDAERSRVTFYLWFGYLAVAFLAVTGGLLAQWLRKEAKVAHLKSDLVAVVSHELRTPLASMRLLVETLQDDEVPAPDKVREYLSLIAAENLRLSRLIENFLTFSRIERNRQKFLFVPTPVSAVIDKAVNTLGERLRSPGCELERNVSDQVKLILADEDAVVAVMVNLLDNACKYTPSPKKITVSACNQHPNVVLSVKDNGIGIAPREQRRIFQRFYQVDQRLARETGGCGLGLSIVEFVVTAHGGTVRVDSSPGAGSTFSITLPCSPLSVAEEAETT